MVLQDTWLFGGTIRDNIAYGRPGATEEEILDAARATYVDRFVHHLPDGYDTVIDEEGDNISAGQKQLLTIARAFLSQPAILILDEATSSVDTRTEVLIQEAMNALRAGRTSFVIAHRLSTIRGADVILVMEDGRIVEQGTHDELLAATAPTSASTARSSPAPRSTKSWSRDVRPPDLRAPRAASRSSPERRQGWGRGSRERWPRSAHVSRSSPAARIGWTRWPPRSAACAVACDLLDVDAVRQVVPSVVDGLGPPEILVSAAGSRFSRERAEGEALDDIRRTIDLNLVAPMVLAQAAFPHMVAAGRGSIVHVSSIGGRVGRARASRRRPTPPPRWACPGSPPSWRCSGRSTRSG